MRLLRLDFNEWRHHEMVDPGGGGGGPVDPYTDPGGGPGAGLPPDWQVFPSTSGGAAPDVPTGPPYSGNYYNSNSRPSAPKSAAPPDLWANIASAVHSAAANLVDKFESLVGGAPSGFDSEGEALALAKSGVNLTTNSAPLDAFQWLFDNKLSAAQQAANQWAQFGMDKDLYTTTVAKMNSSFFDWTGDQLSADGGAAKNSGMWQAIRENWTPDQVRNFAIYGNATGTGPVLAQAQYTGDMPWLSAGQTYSQSLQQFEQMEDQQPVDKATLAAFWRFGATSKQLGGGQGAQEVAAPKQIMTGTVVR